MTVSYKFLSKVPSKLGTQCKKIFISILSILILSVRNREGGTDLLNGKNPLSVTKIICRQYLDENKFLPISSKLKFNFESSNWIVEVIRTRFPCPGLLHFLRNPFLKNPLNGHGQWCYCFKFLEKTRLHWLFHVDFREIRFLK